MSSFLSDITKGMQSTKALLFKMPFLLPTVMHQRNSARQNKENFYERIKKANIIYIG